MDISNPRRILAVSAEDADGHLTRVIKGTYLLCLFPYPNRFIHDMFTHSLNAPSANLVIDLTGTAPEQTSGSLAGASHILSLKTAYYTSEVPIWLDLITSPSEWSASFLSPEAKEVLEVLGGVVVVFSLPTLPHSEEGKSAQELIKHVGKVVKDGLGGWAWDGVGLCLGVGVIDDVDVWEDFCAECGLEFVQVRNSSTNLRNEFGGMSWPVFSF